MFWKIAHFLANRWDQFHMFLWDQIHINRVGPGTFLHFNHQIQIFKLREIKGSFFSYVRFICLTNASALSEKKLPLKRFVKRKRNHFKKVKKKINDYLLIMENGRMMIAFFKISQIFWPISQILQAL